MSTPESLRMSLRWPVFLSSERTFAVRMLGRRGVDLRRLFAVVVVGRGALGEQLVLLSSAAAQSGRVVVFVAVDKGVVELVVGRACSMCATRPARPPWSCRSGCCRRQHVYVGVCVVARPVACVAVVVVIVVDGRGALGEQLVLFSSAAALAQSGRVVVFVAVDKGVVEPVANDSIHSRKTLGRVRARILKL